MTLRIVVVGGVAGGATAAAKARRQNEHADILVLERGGYISFANCGLPYFIGGEIKDQADLLLTTAEDFSRKYNLQVALYHDVQAIDRAAKNLRVCDLRTGEIQTIAYDKLILSQGAAPLVPPLAGVDQDFVFTLRTIPDMLAIDTYLQHQQAQNAVVVGGGYIGLEMAEAFFRRGLDVTVVEAAPHVLPRLEPEFATAFTEAVERPGFRLLSDHQVTSVGDHEVFLANGESLAADVVLLSVGVRPENHLAKAAGLTLGVSGGVQTNGRMESSDPDIYVVGDMAEVRQRQTGAPLRMPLAGPANRQGRIAGANAAGGHLTYSGALGTSILRCLETTVGMVGLNSRDADAAHLNYTVSITEGLHHAGYYPGAETIKTLLLVEEGTGRLLGAQVMGAAGVDKRLDVLATAITAHMTVSTLEEVDLAYAPPFGSPNDPINTASFVVGHELRGDLQIYDPRNVFAGLQLLDVRNANELAEQGYLQGATHIPLSELRERIHELDPAQEWVVYCQKGQRGYLATRILMARGFQVKNMKGGFLQARANHWPLCSPAESV